MARQCAFGLKSLPRATATPLSIIFLAGGGVSLKKKAVVGRRVAIVPASAMAVMPASETASR